MTMESVLRMIVGRSETAGREAIACLRAISARSPMLQHRYNHVVELALNDTHANWTAAERAEMAEYVELTGEPNRDFMLRIRLTEAEHADLQAASDAAGMSMSEWARRQMFS